MNYSHLKIPEQIARITICGVLHFEIHENTDFIFPTAEQKKNLKEMLCIDVEDLRNEGLNEQKNLRNLR